MKTLLLMLVWVFLLDVGHAAAQLYAAVLPSSRSVSVGQPATAFATIINAGNVLATGCRIAPETVVPAAFTYQTTDPATNALTGTPNTPVDIPAGARQTFLIAFTPTAPIPAPPVPLFFPSHYTTVRFTFTCSNTAPAPLSGVNRLMLSATPTPQPDIIVVLATLTGDGIVNVPKTGWGAFALAVKNIGATAQNVTVGLNGLVTDMFICRTNPDTAACLEPATLQVTIATGETMTFSGFVSGSGLTPGFDPEANRVYVTFYVPDGPHHIKIFGSSSVAVRVLP